VEGSLLDDQQRRWLEALTAIETTKRYQRRARLLLLYDRGLPTQKVARSADLSPSQTRFWRRQFMLHGLSIFPQPLFQPDTVIGPLTANRSPSAEETNKDAATTMAASEDPQIEPAFNQPEIRLHKKQHVLSLALALFDATRSLNDLGEPARELLEIAVHLALLREKKKSLRRPRQVYQWLAQGGLELFLSNQEPHATQRAVSVEDRQLLAWITTLSLPKHKKSAPDTPALPADKRSQALALAAILHTALALDESDRQETFIQQVSRNGGQLQVTVSGPTAEQDAAAAQQTKSLWTQAGYPSLQILTTDQLAALQARYPPLPQPMEAIGLLPDDPMAEAGRKVLRFHFAVMLSHEEGTRLGTDIEALHDMRVATRRMRAAFEVFGNAFHTKALRPHLKGLRATGRALGHVRDLDVFMEKAQNYLGTLPEAQRSGLDPLLAHWQEMRENTRIEMLAHLDSQAYQDFKQEFNLFLSTPGSGAVAAPPEEPTPNRVCEVAPILIYSRLAGVRAYDACLSHASVEQLHALRIEFKKFRYTLEFFREVLGDSAKAVIGEVKKLQDHLGDLNDAVVATHILTDFLASWEAQQAQLPITERQNLQAIVAYLAARHDERHRLMVTFQGAWEKFNRPELRQELALAVSVL
jgi:CHAD domain-containing protein/transposase-like protein